MVDPSYRQMGDHTETIQIDFDPVLIDFKEIVNQFWMHHNATRQTHYRGRQYMSLLLYHNESQREQATQLKQKWESEQNEHIQTEMNPFDKFYLAEEKHQKYYLKRFPKAYTALIEYFETHQDFVDSTLVARINGFVREFGSLKDVRSEVENWDLNENERHSILTIINSLKW